MQLQNPESKRGDRGFDGRRYRIAEIRRSIFGSGRVVGPRLAMSHHRLEIKKLLAIRFQATNRGCRPPRPRSAFPTPSRC
jgi:hypothetical protein